MKARFPWLQLGMKGILNQTLVKQKTYLNRLARDKARMVIASKSMLTF